MAGTTYANLESYEGSGAIVIALKRRSRRMTIINDSSSINLQFRFNESEDYATLKPTEVFSMDILTKTVDLAGNCKYRVWVFG